MVAQINEFFRQRTVAHMPHSHRSDTTALSQRSNTTSLPLGVRPSTAEESSRTRQTTRQKQVIDARCRKIGVEVQKAVALLKPWAEMPPASFPHWPFINPNPWSLKLIELGFQDGIVILIFLSRLELTESGHLQEHCLEDYDMGAEQIVNGILAALLNTSLVSAMVLAACVSFSVGEILRDDSEGNSVFDEPIFVVHYAFTLTTFMLSVGGVLASMVTYNSLCVQLPDVDARVRHLRKNRLRIAATNYSVPLAQCVSLTVAVVLGAWTVSTRTGVVATCCLPVLLVFVFFYLMQTPYIVLRDQHQLAREVFDITMQKQANDVASVVQRGFNKASLQLGFKNAARDGNAPPRLTWFQTRPAGLHLHVKQHKDAGCSDGGAQEVLSSLSQVHARADAVELEIDERPSENPRASHSQSDGAESSTGTSTAKGSLRRVQMATTVGDEMED